MSTSVSNAIAMLQEANAKLTEENEQLKQQVAQHEVWRTAIVNHIVDLHTRASSFPLKV